MSKKVPKYQGGAYPVQGPVLNHTPVGVQINPLQGIQAGHQMYMQGQEMAMRKEQFELSKDKYERQRQLDDLKLMNTIRDDFLGLEVMPADAELYDKLKQEHLSDDVLASGDMNAIMQGATKLAMNKDMIGMQMRKKENDRKIEAIENIPAELRDPRYSNYAEVWSAIQNGQPVPETQIYEDQWKADLEAESAREVKRAEKEDMQLEIDIKTAEAALENLPETLKLANLKTQADIDKAYNQITLSKFASEAQKMKVEAFEQAVDGLDTSTKEGRAKWLEEADNYGILDTSSGRQVVGMEAQKEKAIEELVASGKMKREDAIRYVNSTQSSVDYSTGPTYSKDGKTRTSGNTSQTGSKVNYITLPDGTRVDGTEIEDAYGIKITSNVDSGPIIEINDIPNNMKKLEELFDMKLDTWAIQSKASVMKKIQEKYPTATIKDGVLKIPADDLRTAEVDVNVKNSSVNTAGWSDNFKSSASKLDPNIVLWTDGKRDGTEGYGSDTSWHISGEGGDVRYTPEAEEYLIRGEGADILAEDGYVATVHKEGTATHIHIEPTAERKAELNTAQQKRKDVL